jgi:hypothetical protein
VGSYPTVSPLPDAQGVLILESEESGGLLSVALSVGLPRPAVSWHPALWSPDFPQALGSARDLVQMANQSQCALGTPLGVLSVPEVQQMVTQSLGSGAREST